MRQYNDIRPKILSFYVTKQVIHECDNLKSGSRVITEVCMSRL